jgi:hypothetical protein
MVDFGGAAAGVLADRVRFELRQPVAGPFAAVAALLRAFEGWSAVAGLAGGDDPAASGADPRRLCRHRSILLAWCVGVPWRAAVVADAVVGGGLAVTDGTQV